MGGHPWKTTCPYQPDLAAALAAAQNEVFARGEFGFTYSMKVAYAELGQPPPPLPEEPEAMTIDEARQNGAEGGTRSILDVYELAREPAPGVAGPFAPGVLRSDLGTDRPTLAEVEAGLGKLYERLGRGEAAHVTCYENGTPSSYVFLGISFD